MIDVLLYLVLPVLLIPTTLRMVLIPVVGVFARRMYLPKRYNELYRTLTDDLERERMSEVLKLVKWKVRPFGLLRPRFVQDFNDVLVVAAGRENTVIVEEGQNGNQAHAFQVKLDFSIYRMLQTAYRLFEDLYEEYSAAWWFRCAMWMPLGWYVHVGIVWRTIDRFMSHAFVKTLRQGRVFFRVPRLVLIPLIGIPDVIISIVYTLTVGLLSEALFRYVYALVLLKAGYYSLYLFHSEKKSQAERSMSDHIAAKVHNESDAIQTLITAGLPERSACYTTAVDTYTAILRKTRVYEDPLIGRSRQNGFRRSSKRAIRTAMNVFSEKPEDKQELKALVQAISCVYKPSTKFPLYSLRGRELLAAGYFGSILVLDKLLEPAVKKTLGSQRLDLVVSLSRQAMRITGKQPVRRLITGARRGMRSYRYYRFAAAVGKLVLFKQPVALVAFTTWHGTRQALEDTIRSSLYHSVGRLSMYIWECSMAKKSPMQSSRLHADAHS